MTELGEREGMSALQRGIVAGLAAVVTSAVVNSLLAAKAEHDNPPIGRFVVVDGVRLHYVELGSGEPVVFLHGNGSMIQDFASSGILDKAAKSYRVFAFDRPGFGCSDRPNDRSWTPAAQAKLFHKAFAQMGILRPIIVGHSWGTLVALRLAVDYPGNVSRLVLLSGYYFPTVRLDSWMSAPGATPLIGTILQHTISPIIARLASKSAIKSMFDPRQVPEPFNASYSKEMAVRPSQLEAAAAETAIMPFAVETIADHYSTVTMPVRIFAGDQDNVVDTDTQSGRLHETLTNSRLHVEAGTGHMIHHAIPDKIVAALAA
jgi:pimeloyl-ACP methyl ester carboxylesterase